MTYIFISRFRQYSLQHISPDHMLREIACLSLVQITDKVDSRIRDLTMNHLPPGVWSDISYIYYFLPRFTVSCMKLVGFFYSVITFLYTKYFVHSYTVDIVFTLSYQLVNTATLSQFVGRNIIRRFWIRHIYRAIRWSTGGPKSQCRMQYRDKLCRVITALDCNPFHITGICVVRLLSKFRKFQGYFTYLKCIHRCYFPMHMIGSIKIT